MRTAKTLIRLGGCPGWSESSLCAQSFCWFCQVVAHMYDKRYRPELVWDFMPVLVTSKFNEDPIKNERASLETPFSHYKSMGNFSDAQGQLIPLSVVWSGRNSNSFEILCMPSLPASIKRIGSKTTEKRWRHRFPHYKSMGAFCFQSVPKPYATFPPP